jgi:phenylalanyl-tRNA synthetase beta chain
VRVPLSWLREYCDPGVSAEELATELALRAIEVERISHAGTTSPEGFVIGKVLSVERHPDADRLSVCEVETGDGARTIVCGAPNVAAGQTVPVALPGAVMPDGTKLGKAKLRGVESDGMILSERELNIGDDSEGIAVLADERPANSSVSRPGAAGLQAGRPLNDVVAIADPVIELEPTSNRVDCFGIYGVAREVRAITGAELAAPPWEEDAEATGEGTVEDYASVAVEVPDLCPRFTARVFTELTIGPSPLWLKARLVAAGQRPINNVVDITNYVMLMTAQPLHAFDLDKVPGGELHVRTAKPGETMRTLDGVERTFDEETVLVCDRDGPSGIAGIMGGEVSEVSETTTSVLLEVATWNGVNILRTSRNLRLRSDASNRFEKQLHPELAIRAQRIASRLLVELCGARMVPGTIDVAAEPPPPRRIRLRGPKVAGLLGMEVARELREEYLRRLDFEVAAEGEDLEAEVPAHRYYDVTREVDLIEEVGRVHGYANNLPAGRLPESIPRRGGLTREQALRRRAEDVIRDIGFDAVVTLSLADPDEPGRLRIPADDVRAQPITVSNPLSRDYSAMRTTLLGSLLDAARHNLAHGAERVALYESARAYLTHKGEGSDPLTQAGEGSDPAGVLAGEFPGDRPAPAYEPQRIGAVAVGPLVAGGWRDEVKAADFFTLKGALEGLAAQLGCELAVVDGSEPFLHPGRAGRVVVSGEPAGWIGEVHPLVCREWDLERAAAFEVDLAPLVAASPYGGEQYEDVVTHPAVRQDLAVTVPEDTPYARVADAVTEAAGALLTSLRLFDLYRGEQVGEGRKSLALRLEFRAPDRTLTDEEVAERRREITQSLREIGGSLRE